MIKGLVFHADNLKFKYWWCNQFIFFVFSFFSFLFQTGHCESDVQFFFAFKVVHFSLMESFNGVLKLICRIETDFSAEGAILICVLQHIYIQIKKVYLLNYLIFFLWLNGLVMLHQLDNPGENLVRDSFFS